MALTQSGKAPRNEIRVRPASHTATEVNSCIFMGKQSSRFCAGILPGLLQAAAFFAPAKTACLGA